MPHFRFSSACYLALRSVLPLFCACLVLSANPNPAFAQAADEYQQRMDKGIKLYQDNNFDAAIAEFEAAYKISPKPGPLINISLCHKSRFQYPKAIVVLEQALQKHGDSMDAATKKAAEDAITEMRGLLSYVTVTLDPPYATLIIDGEVQPEEAKKAQMIALGPGTHRIGAKAEGYASAEQTITLTSGDKSAKVSLALVPDKGFVTVRTNDPEMAIAIDQKSLAFGEWSGFLTPGAHLVQMYGEDKKPHTVQIIVAAGTTQEITPERGGMPLAAGTVAPPPPPLPPPPVNKVPPPKPQVGPYGLVTGSLLIPLALIKGADDNKISSSSGGAGGLRVGYRVNDYAGFEGLFEYGNTYLANDDESARYKHSTFRLGAALRLTSPGRTARALLTLGFVGAYDRIYDVKGELEGPASGWDPAFLTELGVEFSIGRVLLGGSLQGYFQSARGIDLENSTEDLSAFSDSVLMVLGGGIRVGYSLW